MNILYVENHSVFAATVIRQFLSQHLVTLVPSKSAALLAMKSEKFDLLLVDFDLDDGKGNELVTMLRQAGNNTPIIGVSSHDDGNAALLKAGATAVCCKMQFDEIQAVMDSILDGKKS